MQNNEVGKLLSAAKAATKGPWEAHPLQHASGWEIQSNGQVMCTMQHLPGQDSAAEANAAFVASANPQAILALIERLAAAEIELENLKGNMSAALQQAVATAALLAGMEHGEQSVFAEAFKLGAKKSMRDRGLPLGCGQTND